MARVNIDRIYDSVKSGDRDKPAENSQPLVEGSKLHIVTDEKPRLIKKDRR